MIAGTLAWEPGWCQAVDETCQWRGLPCPYLQGQARTTPEVVQFRRGGFSIFSAENYLAILAKMALSRLFSCVLRRVPVLSLLFGAALLLSGCAHLAQRQWSFVQMCDPQLGFNHYEEDKARFRQAVRQINRLHPDFVVVCGDLVNGASKQSYADFNQIKSGFAMPCYCAPGNHDVGNTPTLATLQRYRQLEGRDYFAVDHKDCTFVVLNSQLWKAPVPGETEKQDQWLATTLREASRHHHPVFVVEHYPIFEERPDEAETYYDLPPAKRQELLELFRTNGVVAVLAGHTHKTLLKEFQGIQMVASQTTSRNFDKQPPGFRVWHIGTQRPYANEFVPLKGEER